MHYLYRLGLPGQPADIVAIEDEARAPAWEARGYRRCGRETYMQLWARNDRLRAPLQERAVGSFMQDGRP